MGQKSGSVKEPAEQVIKEIRRAARRQFSAEEKIRIVLSGLRGEDSIAELCRREGIVQNLYYRWSKEFLEAGKKRLAGDSKKDMSLIGQFGVGFYSAFMVSDTVEVLSRKAGDSEGWRWTSDGKGSFTVEPAANVPRGARITLHVREGDEEYLEPQRIRQIVKRYSDHIALPIVLADGNKEETINAASALWTRARSEITPEQYKEFYHHVAHSFDEPWLTLHGKAEGVLEYSFLLFVPAAKPFDLFDPERKSRDRKSTR